MSVRLMLCAALAALVVSATAASEPTTEARSYAIAIGGVELRPKRDRVIVSVHNLGARPLRRVTVRVSADGGRPRAAPVIGVIPGGGHMETVSVDVSTRDARLVFVTVADEAGWACASRLLRPGRRDIVDAALFLEAHAPEIVTSDRAFRLDLVFRAGPRRGVGGRPRGKGWMSLKLPAGVELVEGEAHRALHLDQPRGITFQLVAKRAGRYRLGAILRRDDGAARAGTVIDLIVRKGAGSGDGLPHEESFGDEDARPDAAQEAPRVEHGAVYNALVWLAAHQSADGGWKAAGFDKWCNGKPNTGRRPDGFGKAPYDPGVTGLALRAFLDAGYTHRGKHPFNDTVGRGLRHLRNIQDAEGCFGPRSSEQFVYNHAAATMAMTKAYDLTQSPLFRGAARRALQFIGKARNPDFAWRYGVRPGDNDTSVSGWMMLAIRGADVETHPALAGAAEGLLVWIDKLTDPDYGRVGYVGRGTGPARPVGLAARFPAEKSEAMTAVGIVARVFAGESPDSEMCRKGAGLMRKRLPVWNERDGSIDMIYWYFGTLAMKARGGTDWRTWRKALLRALVSAQRDDTTPCAFKGSWDPAGPWGGEGGRVYATALMALCLQAAETDK